MDLVVSINPGNGLQVAQFPATSAEEVNQRVAQLRAVQAQWRNSTIETRLALFATLASLIEERKDEIVDLIHLETGKLRADGEPEVMDVAAAVTHHLSHLGDITSERALELDENAFPGTSASLSFEPYGVIGLIMPWNFPFYVPAIFTICAIMAGNTVLLKPSEYSTMIAMKVAELFADAGFPSGVIEIIPGGDETGRALVNAKVDKIFFVGSVEAGRDIMSNAGRIGTPVQPEMGGNSAAIVLEDADIDVAAGGIAWGGTYHSGQDCMGIKRVFVHRAIAQQFLDKLTEIVSGLRANVDYGPYISAEAVAEAKRRIDDASVNGAKVLCGGELDPASGGFWLTPSVILLKNSSYALVSSETFGNVIPVQIVDSTDEAIELTNDSQYGLSNAIFSTDIARAGEIAKQLEAGMVFINDPFATTPGWDYAVGWKSSGLGTMETKLHECVRGRLTTTNAASAERDYWYPY